MQEITIKTQDLVSFTEAARILGISRPSVYVWLKQQKLRVVVELGSNRYLLRVEVEELAKRKPRN